MPVTNEQYWRSTFTDEMKEKDLVILGMGGTFAKASGNRVFKGYAGPASRTISGLNWTGFKTWFGDCLDNVYVVERDSEIARLNGFAPSEPKDKRKFVVTVHLSAGNDTVGEMWRETKVFDADTTLGEMMDWKPGGWRDNTDRIVTLAQ